MMNRLLYVGQTFVHSLCISGQQETFSRYPNRWSYYRVNTSSYSQRERSIIGSSGIQREDHHRIIRYTEGGSLQDHQVYTKRIIIGSSGIQREDHQVNRVRIIIGSSGIQREDHQVNRGRIIRYTEGGSSGLQREDHQLYRGRYFVSQFHIYHI